MSLENPVGYSSLKLSSNESHTKNHYNFLMSEQLLQIKKGTITVCHLMSKVGSPRDVNYSNCANT